LRCTPLTWMSFPNPGSSLRRWRSSGSLGWRELRPWSRLRRGRNSCTSCRPGLGTRPRRSFPGRPYDCSPRCPSGSRWAYRELEGAVELRPAIWPEVSNSTPAAASGPWCPPVGSSITSGKIVSTLVADRHRDDAFRPAQLVGLGAIHRIEFLGRCAPSAAPARGQGSRSPGSCSR